MGVEGEEELASLPCSKLALLSPRLYLQLWVTHIPVNKQKLLRTTFPLGILKAQENEMARHSTQQTNASPPRPTQVEARA